MADVLSRWNSCVLQRRLPFLTRRPRIATVSIRETYDTGQTHQQQALHWGGSVIIIIITWNRSVLSARWSCDTGNLKRSSKKHCVSVPSRRQRADCRRRWSTSGCNKRRTCASRGLLLIPAAMPLVLLQLPPEEEEVDPLPSVKVAIVSDKSRAINKSMEN